jgi:hypothetical protein
MASVENPSNTGGRLIAASKVNGTSVYNTAGESLGSVHDVMLDKASAKPTTRSSASGDFWGSASAITRCPGTN